MDPLIGSLLGLGVLGSLGGLALILWLVRALTLERARRRLSMEDLRLLEESTEHLVRALRQTADEVTQQVDARVRELRQLVLAAEERLGEGSPRGNAEPDAAVPPADDRASERSPSPQPEGGEPEPQLPTEAGLPAKEPDELERLARQGVGPEEIARQLGIGLGEVHLRLGLMSFPSSPLAAETEPRPAGSERLQDSVPTP